MARGEFWIEMLRTVGETVVVGLGVLTLPRGTP